AAVELLDDVGARIADVHVAPRRAPLVAVDRDAGREGELAGPGAGDARQAVRAGLADLALSRPILHAPAPGRLQLALLVEPLDTRIRGIGDEDLAAALIDRHPERGLEQ